VEKEVTLIYAIRQNESIRTLVELRSRKELKPGMERVSPIVARRWVAADMLHETGLYLDDDDKVRYAPKEA